MDLTFTVQKLAKFSENPVKVYFEGLVHLLRYIDMNDAPVYYMLRQDINKNDNHLMAFSDSSWNDFPETVRITGACIIFYQCGEIDHITHVPGPVAQLRTESEYNASCTAGMTLAYFRMFIHI